MVDFLKYSRLAVLTILISSATGFGVSSFRVSVYEDFLAPEGSGFAELQKKADEVCQAQQKKEAVRISEIKFQQTPKFFPTGNNLSAEFQCE